MSVNKLWTLIYDNQEDRVSMFGLVYRHSGIRMSTKYMYYISFSDRDNRAKVSMSADKFCQLFHMLPIS